jgi:D-alanyl-D-alanine carboxypeptidase
MRRAIVCSTEAESARPIAVHLALIGAGCALMLLAAHPAERQPTASAQPVVPGGPKPSARAPLLVSKEHPLAPTSFTPSDLVVTAGVEVSAAAAPDLAAMIDAARVERVLMAVVSGYRSYTEQAELRERYEALYGAGPADEISAQPGHSEHQSGLAVDIADPSGACSLSACFGDTPAGAWSEANAWKYGFIVRYPAGASAITGYSYEPWHLRHVGISVSAAMHDQRIATLEEYLAQGGAAGQ